MFSRLDLKASWQWQEWRAQIQCKYKEQVHTYFWHVQYCLLTSCTNQMGLFTNYPLYPQLWLCHTWLLSSLVRCPCPLTPPSLLQIGHLGDQETGKGKKEQVITQGAAGKAQQCSAEWCPPTTANTTVLSLHHWKDQYMGKPSRKKLTESFSLLAWVAKKSRLMWFNTICLFFPSSLDNFFQFEERTQSFQTQENYQFSVKTDGCGQEKDCVSALLSPSGKRL